MKNVSVTIRPLKPTPQTKRSIQMYLASVGWVSEYSGKERVFYVSPFIERPTASFPEIQEELNSRNAICKFGR